jgi:hypothetical protein
VRPLIFASVNGRRLSRLIFPNVKTCVVAFAIFRLTELSENSAQVLVDALLTVMTVTASGITIACTTTRYGTSLDATPSVDRSKAGGIIRRRRAWITRKTTLLTTANPHGDHYDRAGMTSRSKSSIPERSYAASGK